MLPVLLCRDVGSSFPIQLSFNFALRRTEGRGLFLLLTLYLIQIWAGTETWEEHPLNFKVLLSSGSHLLFMYLYIAA